MGGMGGAGMPDFSAMGGAAAAPPKPSGPQIDELD